jgi:hypothetical protein
MMIFLSAMGPRRTLNCLRFANPAEATGGLEAWRLEARCLRYPGNPFQFQNDLSKFQNNLKCVFSVSK